MFVTEKKGDLFILTIPSNWSGLSIETILKDKWFTPKKLLHELRMEKLVSLNGLPVLFNTVVKRNDFLQIPLFKEEESSITPTYMALEILFEDEHMLIVNKPAGMDTHPNSPSQIDTLTNGVAFHMQINGEFRKAHHVHRLDKDTSGAILFAKHKLASAALDRMLELRLIKRSYLAIVHGTNLKKNGIIDHPIGRDRHHATRRRISKTGQRAITHYKVIQVWPNQKQSLIRCQLETGRTHQIRVHLSSIGHPLVGDTLYGGDQLFKRQALHAYKLELTHPFTGEAITVIAPFQDQPPIFKKYIELSKLESI